MSAAIGFGEYDALLPCDGLTFSRELFSREYVVQRVDAEALAAAVKAKNDLWRGLARVHTGHVIVSVDATPVRGLSWREFNALWQQQQTPGVDTASDSVGDQCRVRFRDRKRADFEVAMQKDWTGTGPTRFAPIPDERELQVELRKAHALIWNHQLTEAYTTLRLLPVGSDPMVCLLAAELEVVRVLVSNDALYSKQAQRTASQAVNWLQGMYELTSLSYSTHKQIKLALAEALFLLSLLRLGAEQRLAAIATARRCAVLYVELGENFVNEPHAASKINRLLMSESELQDFLQRIKFGIAVLHVGGSLALQGTLEWIGALMKETCDPTRGLQYLLGCSSATDKGASHFRANWAALALMHSSGVIRLIRQRELQHKAGISDQLALATVVSQRAALLRHPTTLLFLWSQANATSFDGDRLSQLEAGLTRISACEERAHLVRFDVGYRRFLNRDFGLASVQFMPICKCASAPPKLRGLSSLFLAVGYLVSSHGISNVDTQDAKLLNSVRLLLRSSRRLLSLRLELNGQDVEAASLYERLGAYINNSDKYLQFLPWEILYIFCYSIRATTKTVLRTDISQRCHHVAALERIDQLSESGSLSSCKSDTHEAELSLLRAIVLFNLHELDACQNELQRTWAHLQPSGSRGRAASAFGRLSSPPSPPPAFVAPVAWFYQLRLLLERRCMKSAMTYLQIASSGPVSLSGSSASEVGPPGFGSALQQSPYAYHFIYNGKLQALSKLATRLGNGKIDNNSDTSMYNKKTKLI